MARFCLILLLAALALNSTGSADQTPPGASTGGEAKKAGFELPQKHTFALTPEERKGRELYEYYCSPCHGLTGMADGINSFELSTPPGKLADPAYLAKASDDQLHQVIKEGGPALKKSPQMPAWGLLFNDRQVNDLIAFIKTLPKKAGK